MYLNVLSFKNGKTISFQTAVPYSVDKVKEPTPADAFGDWNLVTDEVNGQILSFRGAEIVTIASAKVPEEKPAPVRERHPRADRYKTGRKPGITIDK